MKRTLCLCLAALALITLLCACTGQSKQNTSENTLPAGKTEQVPMETPEDFEDFIKNTKIGGQYLYVRALGCTFAKPEEIPAWFYFYLGVGENSQPTAEEHAFLEAAYKEKNPNGDYRVVSVIKLPVTKINEALSILGVTIEDIQIPDRWVYYDETESYYFWVSDAYGVTGWSVTKVEKGTNGIVAIYWETKEPYWGDPTLEKPLDGAKMVLTMQAMPDGSYQILSNVPQE